jgi:drug/metabolite transporter (DMT)-like permease
VRGIFQALLAALLFGAAAPAGKWLLADLAPLPLAGLLYAGAALAVAPRAVAQWRAGSGADLRRLDRRNRARLAGAVGLGGVAGPVLLLLGLELALAGSVSLLLHLEMVATAVLGVWLFHEPLGRMGWAGVAAALAGAALLAGAGGWPGIAAALLLAAACVCWALDNHWTALLDGLTPAQTTLAKGVVGGAVNLGLGLALATRPFAPGAVAVGGALLTGALAYGVSIALYIAAAQQLGATRAQTLFAAAPFLGALIAWSVLGEPLGAVHLVAGLLFAASVAALLASAHDHLHEHEPGIHVHSHRHDDGHHDHVHPGLPAWTRHTHPHRHRRRVHAHPHWPDLHHRHRHAPQAEEVSTRR